jgi:hypothetical protein
VHDVNDTAHALDVTAETLYEAVAQALAMVLAGANPGEYRKRRFEDQGNVGMAEAFRNGGF